MGCCSIPPTRWKRRWNSCAKAGPRARFSAAVFRWLRRCWNPGFVPVHPRAPAILFLEDVREAPYRIDPACWCSYAMPGSFPKVAGVVFGEMHERTDGINDLREVIGDVLAEGSFPIAFGLPAGHGEANIALPLGARAVLNSARGRFLLRR